MVSTYLYLFNTNQLTSLATFPIITAYGSKFALPGGVSSLIDSWMVR